LKLGSTNVGQVTSFSLDGIELLTFDASTLNDTAGWKTYARGGRKEPGNASISLLYDPDDTTHQSIGALFTTTTPANTSWTVELADPTPTSITFTSAGGSFGIEASGDEALTATLELKLTGSVGLPDGS
tara:strand:- start:630 stop:1016 length:387 start_codon:yes stop_codon:yes gene_type:complete